MKLKSAICSVAALIVLSVSTAWAAETPKPGKTKEETAFNKATLKCKTEYPSIVNAVMDAHAGKSVEQIRSKFLAQFDKDEAAGIYYATVLDRTSWADTMSAVTFKQGNDFRKSMPDMSSGEMRRKITDRLGTYVEGCAKNNIRNFLD